MNIKQQNFFKALLLTVALFPLINGSSSAPETGNAAKRVRLSDDVADLQAPIAPSPTSDPAVNERRARVLANAQAAIQRAREKRLLTQTSNNTDTSMHEVAVIPPASMPLAVTAPASTSMPSVVTAPAPMAPSSVLPPPPIIMQPQHSSVINPPLSIDPGPSLPVISRRSSFFDDNFDMDAFIRSSSVTPPSGNKPNHTIAPQVVPSSARPANLAANGHSHPAPAIAQSSNSIFGRQSTNPASSSASPGLFRPISMATLSSVPSTTPSMPTTTPAAWLSWVKNLLNSHTCDQTIARELEVAQNSSSDKKAIIVSILFDAALAYFRDIPYEQRFWEMTLTTESYNPCVSPNYQMNKKREALRTNLESRRLGRGGDGPFLANQIELLKQQFYHYIKIFQPYAIAGYMLEQLNGNRVFGCKLPKLIYKMEGYIAGSVINWLATSDQTMLVQPITAVNFRMPVVTHSSPAAALPIPSPIEQNPVLATLAPVPSSSSSSSSPDLPIPIPTQRVLSSPNNRARDRLAIGTIIRSTKLKFLLDGDKVATKRAYIKQQPQHKKDAERPRSPAYEMPSGKAWIAWIKRLIARREEPVKITDKVMLACRLSNNPVAELRAIVKSYFTDVPEELRLWNWDPVSNRTTLIAEKDAVREDYRGWMREKERSDSTSNDEDAHPNPSPFAAAMVEVAQDELLKLIPCVRALQPYAFADIVLRKLTGKSIIAPNLPLILSDVGSSSGLAETKKWLAKNYSSDNVDILLGTLARGYKVSELASDSSDSDDDDDAYNESDSDSDQPLLPRVHKPNKA